jgi:diguanylate cyclase (GGDEF)-like protein
MSTPIEHRPTGRGRVCVVLARVEPRLRVLLFGAGLAIVGAALLLTTPDATVTPDRPWTVPFFALVIAFGVAEATALHVEIRKESHSLSLSGIPLMFGLLYLSPVLLATAYLFGSVPTMLWIRKSDWVKTTWNSCLFMTEAALAAFIVRHLLGMKMPDEVHEWLIPLAAVLAAEMMSLIAVPLVIMFVDVTFRPNLFAAVGQSQVLATLAGTFTVTAVSASVTNPYMAFFALLPVFGVGALLQATGGLSQRHRDLQQIHTFTSALTNEQAPRTVDIGLAELVQIMRTRTAGLMIATVDAERESTLRVLADENFEDRDPDAVHDLLLSALEQAAVTELDADDERPNVRELLRRLHVTKLLAARVLGEVDEDAVLFVGDRLGMRAEFTSDELRLFGSLANTLSSRLANDHLVGQLETQARHDALTGLPNRLSFEIELTASLADPAQSGVVVMIDLDRFKEINDSLGHDAGDRLLIELARRLRHVVRPTDVVARFGGDEFALSLVHRSSDEPDDLERRISEIHAAITSLVEFDGIAFEVGASIGVAQWPLHGNDSACLLQLADAAMYEAKRNQLGVIWYTPELDADAPRRLDLYLSARAALVNEELFVHFQPKVSSLDGRVTGVEALVRWTHPTYGPISPLEFVPLIAQAGLIGRLTRYVLQRAVEAVIMFRSAGIDVPVAVNLTPRDLLDGALPDDIARILSDANVEPSSLFIEITEDSMVVDFDTSSLVLNRIRDLGVHVAIDDFGTGYSSLQHLHRLPVDQIKIDRSFISRLKDDPFAAAIVRASINLANDLRLNSVAEGVEDEHALRIVTRAGCQEIQGFLVSRPLPVSDFIRWALEWNPLGFLGLMHEHTPRLVVTP